MNNRRDLIALAVTGCCFAFVAASKAGLIDPPTLHLNAAESAFTIAVAGVLGLAYGRFVPAPRRASRLRVAAPLELTLSALYEAEGDWINASLPALPAVVTCAKSKDEARAMLADALREYLLSLDQTNRPADARPDDHLGLAIS